MTHARSMESKNLLAFCVYAPVPALTLISKLPKNLGLMNYLGTYLLLLLLIGRSIIIGGRL